MGPYTKVFRTSSLASALGALLLALAVSASAQEAPKTPSGTTDRSTITLMVENNNFLEVHVYGMRDGYFRSLGTVTGLSKAKLTIPETLTTPGADFRILADPIGGTLSYLTDPIVMGTGQEVELRIQNDLALSYFTIR